MRIKRFLHSIWFKASIVVLISFFLALFIKHEVLSVTEFSPIKRTTEFKTSDLYSATLHQSSIHRRSDDVVIISANDCSREDIFKCLSKVLSYSPSVVALDIIFEYPQDSDSLLRPLLADEHLVFGSYLCNVNLSNDATAIEQSYFNSQGIWNEGVINLSSSHIIRTFNPIFTLNGKQVLNCFAGEIVKLYSPSKYVALMERESSDQIPILFHKVDFEDLSIQSILNDEISPDILNTILKGKIALIGVTDDPADQFTTPVADNYPGVYIHANIIDTILQEYNISVFSIWIDYMISLIVCFIFILIYFKLKECVDDLSNFIMRIIQVIILIVLCYCGLRLYDNNYYMNCVLPMLTISFSTLVSDVYLGIESIIIKYGKVCIIKLKGLL